MSLELYAPCPQELVHHCLAIRHQIYCEKLKWEPQSPDGLERQEEDERSHHVLVVEDGCPIATTRVTPLEPYNNVAELGRTAISDSCKDRAAVRRMLVEGVKQILKLLKIEHCISLMEDRMRILERRYGFVWAKSVTEVEHNGRRRFHYMRVPQ